MNYLRNGSGETFRSPEGTIERQLLYSEVSASGSRQLLFASVMNNYGGYAEPQQQASIPMQDPAIHYMASSRGPRVNNINPIQNNLSNYRNPQILFPGPLQNPAVQEWTNGARQQEERYPQSLVRGHSVIKWLQPTCDKCEPMISSASFRIKRDRALKRDVLVETIQIIHF